MKITLEEAITKYYKTFNKNYPLLITGALSSEEIIEDILDCVAKREEKPEPIYDPNTIY